MMLMIPIGFHAMNQSTVHATSLCGKLNFLRVKLYLRKVLQAVHGSVTKPVYSQCKALYYYYLICWLGIIKLGFIFSQSCDPFFIELHM